MLFPSHHGESLMRTSFLTRCSRSSKQKTSPKQSLPKAKRRVELEALEERLAPTANLYLDFGTSFPGGTLGINVGTMRSNLPAGLQGPDFRGGFFGGATDASTLTLTRMSN